MIVVMCIGLYTVRAILDLLGVVDYGIYNVVGGVVSMFSFMNGTLASSSQRFFSIELAKGNSRKLNEWFCLNITVFSTFIIAFIIISETVGLWFVNYRMTIPQERLFATNVIYQFSIISFCASFFAVPYEALIIARERMSAFAYISIVEAFLKLGIVFVLALITWDKLIVYGFLMFLTSCGITSSYILYNHRHFSESRFKPYWNKEDVKNLFGFSGWHFLGTISVVVRSQCINILINLFFNPAINAARAIAFQVFNAVSQLSNNFFVAVKPQIYKSYANGEFDALHKLILRSTIVCTFLVSILVIPILTNVEFVLGIWLKEVPAYAILFTQLVIINGLIDASSNSTIAPALATGKIKKFYLYVGTLYIFNLPISYMFLKLGYDAPITMVVSIFLSMIALFVRAYLLIDLVQLSFRLFSIVVWKMTVATILIYVGVWYVTTIIDNSILKLIITTIFSFILHVVLYIAYVFDRHDVSVIIEHIKEKIQRK